MPRVKYLLLLPLNYNDGSEVPKEVRDRFFDDVFVLAGGYHIAGTGTGAYRMQDGTKQVDPSLEVWIAVEEADVPALKELVATYAGILQQESLYLEHTGGTVEFITPRPAEGTPPMTKPQEVLASARQAALNAESWADLSNVLFDPDDGLVARAYPTREERERFVKTKEYRAIRELIDAATQQSGLIEGARPKKSGRFVVRLPSSLHEALEAEARAEGVSLNQLVLTKLAVQMKRLTASPMPDAAGTGRRGKKRSG